MIEDIKDEVVAALTLLQGLTDDDLTLAPDFRRKEHIRLDGLIAKVEAEQQAKEKTNA